MNFREMALKYMKIVRVHHGILIHDFLDTSKLYTIDYDYIRNSPNIEKGVSITGINIARRNDIMQS